MSELEKLKNELQELKEREEILQVALSLTNHVVTYVDLKKHAIMHVHHEGNWDGITTAMENVPESIIESGIIYPDDIEGYRKFFQDMYDGVPEGSYILRSRENDKGWLWFNIIYKTIFDTDGTPLRAVCFSDDITVVKTAELRYKQYKDVVSAGADFVWEVDLSKNLILSISGDMSLVIDGPINTYSDLVALGLSGVSDDDLRAEAADLFSAENMILAYQNAKREISLSYPYRYNDGSGLHYMTVTAHLRSNTEGHILAILCVKDITYNHNILEALQDKAETDPLTRLYNRRGLDRRISSILESYPNFSHGYIIFDIDNFKLANDNFGHAYGDEILKLVADTMRSTFRQNDVLCRIGGDEFTIFMQNAGSLHTVITKADALRENLHAISEEKNLKFSISISAGVTLFLPGEDTDTMYKRADKALYRSKETGKDKVSFI